jgi:hypothetical protein
MQVNSAIGIAATVEIQDRELRSECRLDIVATYVVWSSGKELNFR